MTSHSLRQLLKSLGWSGTYSPHATRTTGSTRLNEMGYRPDAIEAQLAHADTDLATSAGLSPRNLPEAGIGLLLMIKLFNFIVFITASATIMKNEFTFHLIWNCVK